MLKRDEIGELSPTDIMAPEEIVDGGGGDMVELLVPIDPGSWERTVAAGIGLSGCSCSVIGR